MTSTVLQGYDIPTFLLILVGIISAKPTDVTSDGSSAEKTGKARRSIVIMMGEGAAIMEDATPKICARTI